ncbi:MAG: hypothetical protein ACE5GT_07965 [Rhodospirillales bacterium]
MIGLRSRRFPAAVALGVLLGMAGAARADCPSFPKVPWWKGLTHESVTGHVERNYGGNWKVYTDAWDRLLVKLQEIQLKGSTAVIKSSSVPGGRIKLRGPKLDSYIDTVRRRLTVTRCLGRQAGAR